MNIPLPGPGWTLFFGALLVAGVFLATREYYRRRERATAALERLRSVERAATLRAERSRVAQDLHDQLGAHLTEIARASGNARLSLDQPQAVEEGLRSIEGNARSLVESLAELVWVAQPANDTLERLVQHLVLHTTRILEPTAIAHRFELPRDLPDRPVPPQVRRELSLAVKEALHNVVRHAGATRVDLAIRVEDGSLRVSIQDNRRPASVPDPDGHARGNGLPNMKERMRRLGGCCDVRFLDTGTGVTLELPLDPPAPAIGVGGPRGDPAKHPSPIRDGA